MPRIFLFLYLVLFSFVSLSEAAVRRSVPLAKIQPFSVGYLEREGKLISLKAGPEGTLFSVERYNGSVLAKDVTARELYEQSPRLYRTVMNAIKYNDTGSFIEKRGRKPNLKWKSKESRHRARRQRKTRRTHR